MSHAARIVDSIVVEVVQLPDGLAPTDCYHPDAGFVACPAGTVAGMIYAGGAFGAAPPPPPPTPEQLAELKSRAKTMVDADAERERLRYITPGEGQVLTYLRKVEQARAAITAANPQPADYPLLAATIGLDGVTVTEVAQTILAMDAAWEQIGAAIEQVRMTAKAAIDAAADVAALQAARDAVQWPAPA